MAATRIVEFAGIPCLIGLQWRVLNMGSHTELLQTAKKFSYSQVVTVGQPPVCAGYVPRGMEKQVPAKIPSAAALLVRLLPADVACMVIEQVHDNSGKEGYWFVVLQEGVIYPDTDVFIADLATLKEYQARFQEHQLQSYGNGFVALDPQSEKLPTVGELFARATDRRQLARCRLQTVKHNTTRWVVLSLSILAIGWLLARYFFAAIPQNNPQTTEELRMQVAEELQQKYQVALAGPDTVNFVAASLKTLADMPLYVAHWQIDSIECAADYCQFRWFSATGTLPSLAQALAVSLDSLQTDSSGDFVVIQMRQQSTSAEKSTLTNMTAGERNDFIMLCQHIRRFSTPCYFEEAQTVSVSEPELLPAGQLFRQGNFRISGTLSVLRPVAARLVAGWIKPQRLQIDFKDMENPSWTMEGHYVLQ